MQTNVNKVPEMNSDMKTLCDTGINIHVRTSGADKAFCILQAGRRIVTTTA
jgi:hypothetical protein